jgi:hypothetical protein
MPCGTSGLTLTPQKAPSTAPARAGATLSSRAASCRPLEFGRSWVAGAWSSSPRYFFLKQSLLVVGRAGAVGRRLKAGCPRRSVANSHHAVLEGSHNPIEDFPLLAAGHRHRGLGGIRCHSPRRFARRLRPVACRPREGHQARWAAWLSAPPRNLDRGVPHNEAHIRVFYVG